MSAANPPSSNPSGLESSQGRETHSQGSEKTGRTNEVQGEDDLTLQFSEDESEAADEGGGGGPMAPPSGYQSPSATLINLDPGRILVLVALVGFVIIMVGAYSIFAPSGDSTGIPDKAVPAQERSSEPTPTGKGANQNTSAGNAGPALDSSVEVKSAVKEKKLSPKQKELLKTEDAYRANEANRTCFYAYWAFMVWAQQNAMPHSGDTMADQFRGKVSKTGVDDPDVLAIHSNVLDLFRRYKTQPLNTIYWSNPKYANPSTPGGPSGQDHRKRFSGIQSLARKLIKRYGKPD